MAKRKNYPKQLFVIQGKDEDNQSWLQAEASAEQLAEIDGAVEVGIYQYVGRATITTQINVSNKVEGKRRGH